MGLILALILQLGATSAAPVKPEITPEFAAAVKQAGAGWYWKSCCGFGAPYPSGIYINRQDPEKRSYKDGSLRYQYIDIDGMKPTELQAAALGLIKSGAWAMDEERVNGQTWMQRWMVGKDGKLVSIRFLDGQEECRHWYDEAKKLEEIKSVGFVSPPPSDQSILLKMQLYNACVTAGGYK